MGLATRALADLARSALDGVVDNWPYDATELPERQYVSDGSIVWDCPTLAVMAEATYGTTGDPAFDAVTGIGMGYALRGAVLVVTVLRCTPDVDDDGNPPPIAAIEESADVILTDSIAVLNALMATQAAGDLVTCNGLVFERWSSVGPESGLGGGVTRIRALLL